MDKLPSVETLEQAYQHLIELRNVMGDSVMNLTLEERRSSRSMAHRREAYVRRVLEAVQQYLDTMPRNFNEDAFQKLYDAYHKMRRLVNKSKEVTELLDDTLMAFSIDLMKYTDEAYYYLQGARNSNQGLDEVMRGLEEYNRRGRNGESENEETPPQ